jgi:peptidoglycan/xylan/chitin deacetylase (PgdA/CDA1 family)
MNQPNILMYHRIEIENAINNLYFKRKMVVSFSTLCETIDNYLLNGYLFGSIENCLQSEKYFHLSFDDGFKEHLKVAKLLKLKYNIENNCITFSINIGNSYLKCFTGMDLIYSIFETNQQSKFFNIVNLAQTQSFEFNQIKNIIAILNKNELLELSNQFSDLYPNLKDVFLSPQEVIELSKLFSIASHGITHRFLTYDLENSEIEIENSKTFLEKELNQPIEVFCYPEGKNNSTIQKFCQNAGYKYGLSIKHEPENNYCIGRIIK